MKIRSFLIFAALLTVCLTANAQRRPHLKIYGIPITGTIDNFTKKLQEKGVKYDLKSSREIKEPVRCFEGKFIGYFGDIYAYYIPKSRIVYKVRVVLPFGSVEHAISTVREIEDKLQDKYEDLMKYVGDGEEADSVEDGSRDLMIPYYPNKNDDSELYATGFINMFVDKSDYSDEIWNVYIDYIDDQNHDLWKKSEEDDL